MSLMKTAASRPLPQVSATQEIRNGYQQETRPRPQQIRPGQAARQEGGRNRLPVPGQEKVAATPARRLAEEHLASRPGLQYGFYADASSKPDTVAVGLAMRKGDQIVSCLIAVPKAEWCPVKFMKALDEHCPE